MLLSMTGFGKGECAFGDGNLMHIEISSVNRKQLEIRFSMPQELAPLEISGRKIIGEVISRGAVQVRVTLLAAENSVRTKVDHTALDYYINEYRNACQRNGIAAGVAVEKLMQLPGVLTSGTVDPESPELAGAFEKALRSAAANFCAMRAAEGAELKKDLEARLKNLETMHAQLQNLTAGQPAAAKQRLLARFEAEKFPIAADDPALLRELIFYIDKGDVTEELTRLCSHFVQFRNFLESDGPVGRSLDFLAQELFREITTLGNKAFVPEVSPIVVTFKTEMEKIREQLQNIE